MGKRSGSCEGGKRRVVRIGGGRDADVVFGVVGLFC